MEKTSSTVLQSCAITFNKFLQPFVFSHFLQLISTNKSKYLFFYAKHKYNIYIIAFFLLRYSKFDCLWLWLLLLDNSNCYRTTLTYPNIWFYLVSHVDMIVQGLGLRLKKGYFKEEWFFFFEMLSCKEKALKNL